MELLKTLTHCVSPSGRENSVREIIKNELRDVCDEIFTDALGNIICHKSGNGKRLMLAAHMDEIGFMVTYIDDNGFLRFSTVGGVRSHNSINLPIEFPNGTKGKISYEKELTPSNVNFDKMFIDIGATTKSEAEKKVQIGDMAVYSGNFEIIGERIMSKALDDRSGCWSLVRAMQSAKDSPNDLYAVFTAQEEVGLRGAKTAANRISPDMAIAIDVSTATDIPESTSCSIKLGKGPAIKLKDASFIIHGAVKNLLLDCVNSDKIPFQLQAASLGGTDTGAIHVSGYGVPGGTISIPTRYVHSATEVIDCNDLKNTCNLIQTVIATDITNYLI